jgi:GTP-binding protein HflX
VKDRVFETLDTVSRRWYLPTIGEVLLTDTVGFIRDLPKDLVAAFQTTLQELEEADLLLHVIDAHALDPEQHIRAVEQVLTELGFENIPRLRFFNKGDLLESEDMQRLCQRFEGIGGSALDATSLQAIQEEIAYVLQTRHDRTSRFSEADATLMDATVISENGVA